MQEYLKKYSTVSNQFVDDFFGLYVVSTKLNDYVINIDVVAKWLKSTKAHLKETLIRSYTKNLDYKISKGNSTGGRPSEIILLIPDCFKRLCMLSKTKKAEEVRTYFLQLEKHIDKYKNYIVEALEKRVNVLENNQKPLSKTKKGVLYVFKSDMDLVKIGRSGKIKPRLMTHNNSHPDNVEVALVYESDDIEACERCLKAILKGRQYRKRKEFYEINIDLLKELIEDCDKISLKAKIKLNKFKQTGGLFIMIDKK